jgi:hypothetical protein
MMMMRIDHQEIYKLEATEVEVIEDREVITEAVNNQEIIEEIIEAIITIKITEINLIMKKKIIKVVNIKKLALEIEKLFQKNKKNKKFKFNNNQLLFNLQ